MILETQRLLLRPIQNEDALDIFAYSSEPEVGPNAGWKPHETLEETLAVMQNLFLQKEDIWGIFHKETQKIIGTIGLVPDPKRENLRSRMLGYAMSKTFWGQGLMTEAGYTILSYGFMAMNMDLAAAYCYPFNRRSQRVLQKLGFIYEGTLTQAEQLYTGDILDNLCFALTKQAFSYHQNGSCQKQTF